jgi:hypothetical protein
VATVVTAVEAITTADEAGPDKAVEGLTLWAQDGWPQRHGSKCVRCQLPSSCKPA